MQRWGFIALAGLAAAADAQEPAKRDPTDPWAGVPAAEYRSAFSGYRAFSDEKIAPWRESNDALKGAAGGHEGHSAPPADKTQAPKPPAGEAPQGGHR